MNPMKLEELVRRIREAIQTQGLLQKDIASHCGMTPAMLSCALSGKSNMREERWRLACEYCGIDFDAVMGYKKPAPPPDVFPSSDNTPPQNEAQGETTMNEDFVIYLTDQEKLTLRLMVKDQIEAMYDDVQKHFETLRVAFRIYDKLAEGGAPTC